MRAHYKLNTIRKNFTILGIIILSLSLFHGCRSKNNMKFLSSRETLRAQETFALRAQEKFALRPREEDASWVRETNIYQLFVDRFGGDLDGVREKLDYLETLGVKAIWLMPIFKAMSDHGYDTVNYYSIDPRYGDIEDLRKLVSAAKQKDIRIILDLVVNHLGKDHPWFSHSDPNIRKDHWFVWEESNLDWNLPWGEGQPWHLDPYSHLDRDDNGNPDDDNYFYAVFSSTMPDLNFNDSVSRHELINEVENIMKFWINETGVNGFRCDAVRYLVEEGDGLQKDLAATHEIWKEIRRRLEGINPSAILLAEAPTEEYDEMLDYYGNGDEFHCAFHFKYQGDLMNTLKQEKRPSDLMKHLYAIQNHLPSGTQDAIFLSNHDQFAGDRVASQLENDTAKMKSVASLYLLLSGNPVIYYGEEIGMRGAGNDHLIRMPMDWQAVEVQKGDPGSLLNHYRQILTLRNTYAALSAGITYFVPTYCRQVRDSQDSESKTLSIIREYFGEKILVVHNFSPDNLEICVDLSKCGLDMPEGTEAHALMGGGSYETVNNFNRSIYRVGNVFAFNSKVVFLGNIDRYRNNQGEFITYENVIPPAFDVWYFRGTPNYWGTTLMGCVDGSYNTIQEFYKDNPRFKISRYKNWLEAYPSSDYLITQGPGTYKIIFNPTSKEITAQKLDWNHAYFRGTPNGWGITPMVKEGEHWVIRQAFEGDNPRFKITPYPDWCEAYPAASDYLITLGPGNYKITFNDSAKDISVYKQ